MPSGIFYACYAMKAGVPRRPFWRPIGRISASVLQSTSTSYSSRFDAMGLVGILVSLGLLIWLSFRGWSVLLLAPAVALLAAALAGEPLLAHWTQTFMGSAAQFIAQFFPIFILGALFGKLMDDSGSVQTIQFHEHQTRPPTGNSCCRACGSVGYLRRRKSFRCLFCPGADGARIISRSRYPAAADARSN